jgi:hypothetical protein
MNAVNQNPFSGFTADYNNVYYRASQGTINYLTGFIKPSANFTLDSGYVGQPLTIQAAAAVTATGSFMDSDNAAGATGATLILSAQNAVASLVFNGTQWVVLYRSASVNMP